MIVLSSRGHCTIGLFCWWDNRRRLSSLKSRPWMNGSCEWNIVLFQFVLKYRFVLLVLNRYYCKCLLLFKSCFRFNLCVIFIICTVLFFIVFILYITCKFLMFSFLLYTIYIYLLLIFFLLWPLFYFDGVDWKRGSSGP